MARAQLTLERVFMLVLALNVMVASAVACSAGAAATSLSTSLSGGGKSGETITVVEGSAVKDQATLSGENAFKATGTVKYAVYSDKECKTLVTKAGEVAVKEGKIPPSEEKILEAGAVYYWQAVYSGDANNSGSASPCGKEVLTVKATTTLKTTLSGGGKEGEEITVVEGSGVKDTATLSGTKASTATGTVKYAVYSDKECKTLVSKAGEGSVKEGKAAASEEKKPEAGAVYYWQAEYGGDSLHEPSTSTCSKEVLTVKATTTLKTTLSGGGKEGEEITVVEGSGIKDQATLSGTKSSTATGTVKYAVYSDKECKTLVSKAGEVAVKEGKAPASEEKTLEAGAVYYWQAEYGGDSLHEPSTSTCSKEVLTVKATTSLKTSLSGGGKEGEEITVVEGTGVKDTATLSGTKASTATGTVKYALYSDKECKELVAKAGEGSVEAGKAAGSEEKKPEAAAIYYWQAEYSGDSLHEPSTSACSKEVLTVKATTSLKTTLSGGGKEGEEITVVEGSGIKDTATLSGTKASTATGTVKYAVYSDKECKTLVSKAGEGSVEAGKAAGSEEKKPEAAAIYYWQAQYSGDSLHEPSTSACGKEVLTVKATTTLTTSLSGEEQSGEKIEVQEEAAVTDTATVNGTKAATATGSVKYAVYSDEECKELVAEAGEVTVKEGKAPASEEKKFKAGAYYYWQAEYSGDALHEPSTSTCGTEIDVVANDTSLSTLLWAGAELGEEEVELGEEVAVQKGVGVTDTATLGGTNASEATGTVEYTVYSDEECKEPVAEAGKVSVEGKNVPRSSVVTLPAGTYYWQAHYYGDSFNKGSTSACGAEVQTVTESPLTTSLSGEEQSGESVEVQEETAVTDVATLHGENASEATGTVEYAVYSDEECKELVTKAGEVSVEGETTPSSSEVKLPLGVYYWQAVYSGDENNPAASSVCGTEIEVVAGATSLTTSLSGEEQTGAEIEVQEEVAVTDTATLSGANASEANGGVIYNVYSDSKCEALAAKAGSVEVEGGVVPESEKVKLPAGTYYWQAQFLGDAANKASTSPCGSEIEVVALAPLTTSLSGEEQSGEEIEVGNEVPVKDSATLHGESSATATGTVKYAVYSDEECKELVTKAGEVAVTEGKIPASEEVKLSAGTYYWKAEYSGDLEHEGATSVCGTALQIVIDTWIVSVGDSFTSGEGARWAGNVNSSLSDAADSRLIDALGPDVFRSWLNREDNGVAIPGCRRSHSAEVFIRLTTIPDGSWVYGRNLACSGAQTKSRSEGGLFKPGLDSVNVDAGKALYPSSNPFRGACPLLSPAKCKGQAKLLEELAKELKDKDRGEKIKMIVISIGGNNFSFGDVVTECVWAYEVSWWYNPCNETQAGLFEPIPVVQRQGEIESAIVNIGGAMINAGVNANEFTILVQDYPSVIPSEGGFRYTGATEANRSRRRGGGCPFLNADANWANGTVIPTINSTVKTAALNVDMNTAYKVNFMELEKAFVGRRLCETGVTLVRDGSQPALRNWEMAFAVNASEWVNQIRLGGGAFDIRESAHPNYWGQLALRNCLRRMYNNGTPFASKECTIRLPGREISLLGRFDWLPEPKMKLD